MKCSSFTAVAVATAALLATTFTAGAQESNPNQSYPSRPITIKIGRAHV